MTILAFLQNQWFHSPERMKKLLATHYQNDRELFTRTFLFWESLHGMCLTGRRLQNAFGAELCDQIIWEEASPEICGKASVCPPADAGHMGAVIAKNQPEVIMTFGNVAGTGLLGIPRPTVHLIMHGPHPAARGKEVITQLATMADHLRRYIASNAEADR